MGSYTVIFAVLEARLMSTYVAFTLCFLSIYMTKRDITLQHSDILAMYC